MVETRKLEKLVGYQRTSLADFSLSVTPLEIALYVTSCSKCPISIDFGAPQAHELLLANDS